MEISGGGFWKVDNTKSGSIRHVCSKNGVAEVQNACPTFKRVGRVWLLLWLKSRLNPSYSFECRTRILDTSNFIFIANMTNWTISGGSNFSEPSTRDFGVLEAHGSKWTIFVRGTSKSWKSLVEGSEKFIPPQMVQFIMFAPKIKLVVSRIEILEGNVCD